MHEYINVKDGFGKTNLDHIRDAIREKKNIEQDKFLKALGETQGYSEDDDWSNLGRKWLIFMNKKFREGDGKFPKDSTELSEAIWHSLDSKQKKIVPISILKEYLNPDYPEFEVVKKAIQDRISRTQQKILDECIENIDWRESFLEKTKVPHLVSNPVPKKDTLIEDSKFVQALWNTLSSSKKNLVSQDIIKEHLDRPGKREELKIELERQLQAEFYYKAFQYLTKVVESKDYSSVFDYGSILDFFKKEGITLNRESGGDKLYGLVKPWLEHNDLELQSTIVKVLENPNHLEEIIMDLETRKCCKDKERKEIFQNLEWRISISNMIGVLPFINRDEQSLEDRSTLTRIIWSSLKKLEREKVPMSVLKAYLDQNPAELLILKQAIQNRLSEVILSKAILDFSNTIKTVSMASEFLEENGAFIEDSKFAEVFWNTLGLGEKKLVSLGMIKEYLARPIKLKGRKGTYDSTKLEEFKKKLKKQLREIVFGELREVLSAMDFPTLASFFKKDESVSDIEVRVDRASRALEEYMVHVKQKPQFLHELTFYKSILATIFDDSDSIGYFISLLRERKALDDQCKAQHHQDETDEEDDEDEDAEQDELKTAGKKQSLEIP